MTYLNSNYIFEKKKKNRKKKNVIEEQLLFFNSRVRSVVEGHTACTVPGTLNNNGYITMYNVLESGSTASRDAGRESMFSPFRARTNDPTINIITTRSDTVYTNAIEI